MAMMVPDFIFYHKRQLPSLLPSPFSPTIEVSVVSIISTYFFHIFFIFSLNSAHVFVVYGFYYKLSSINCLLWGRFYFLHLSVTLLKADDIASGYTWKSSSSLNAVKDLKIISVTCLHSHSA